MRGIKTISILLSVSILFIFCLSSCGKQGSDDQTDQYYIKATIDGTAVNCNVTTAYYNKKDKILSFSGRSGAGGNLGGFDFNISPFLENTGTIQMGFTQVSSVLGLYRTSDKNPEKDIYSSAKGSGQIIITSYSNNILKGTFEMIGMNGASETKVVSKGEFLLKVTDL